MQVIALYFTAVCFRPEGWRFILKTTAAVWGLPRHLGDFTVGKESNHEGFYRSPIKFWRSTCVFVKVRGNGAGRTDPKKWYSGTVSFTWGEVFFSVFIRFGVWYLGFLFFDAQIAKCCCTLLYTNTFGPETNCTQKATPKPSWNFTCAMFVRVYRYI